MPTVQLRDIETENDVEAVMGLRRGPGRDRYIGSMISHFEDAVRYQQACPRTWSVHDGESGALVGFVMISDGIPREVLDADDDIVGPYFLWRLLIDSTTRGGATAGRRSMPSSRSCARGRTPMRCTSAASTGPPLP
jgi:diamine N-acetyltransferase